MLTIRLHRTGRTNYPSFKIVVTDKTKSSTGGRFIEEVGFYNSATKEKVLKNLPKLRREKKPQLRLQCPTHKLCPRQKQLLLLKLLRLCNLKLQSPQSSSSLKALQSLNGLLQSQNLSLKLQQRKKKSNQEPCKILARFLVLLTRMHGYITIRQSNSSIDGAHRSTKKECLGGV